MKTTHIITSLHPDGAQQALYRVLMSLGDRAQDMHVISLTGEEVPIGDAIRRLGVRVDTLRMRSGWPVLRDAMRLLQLVRRGRPEVVVTWLYHADLLGGVAAKLAGRLPVVWNVRQSGMLQCTATRSLRAAAGACLALSRRLPAAIVYCSEKSQQEHVAAGYPAERSIVIPNGFDLQRFRPRGDAAARVRAELNLAESALVVGHFGRFHPDKDHPTLLSAAARVIAAQDDVHFVLCGRHVHHGTPQLTQAIERLGLAGRCHLLDHRSDVAELMPGMDVIVSSSRTEAFSNAIGEALASGVPCVATDVGESRAIVGPGGEVVPPREPRMLAAACLRMLQLPRAELARIGRLGRQHVERKFEIAHLAQAHYGVWRAAATGSFKSEVPDQMPQTWRRSAA